MNNSFGNDPMTQENNTDSATQPVQPAAWTPAPATIAPDVAPVQPESSPFVTPTIPDLVVPASSPVLEDGPTMMSPAPVASNLWLYIVLSIIVVLGLLFLVFWMGWIKVDSFTNLFVAKDPVVTTPIEKAPVVVVNKNDATRKTDLINLKTALNQYFLAKQSYPISATISKTSDSDSPLKVLVPDYLTSLPIDPLSPTNYYGYKSVDGKTFQLTAVLEDQSDQSGTTIGSLFLYVVTNDSQETPVASNPVSNESTSSADIIDTSNTDQSTVFDNSSDTTDVLPSTDSSSSSLSSTSTSGDGSATADSSADILP